MFRLFKEKLTSKNRAYLIATTTSDFTGGLDETVDKFLLKYPGYRDKRNIIIDELQWIIATSGLIAVRILSEHKKAKETYEQLIEFYRALHKSNNHSTLFTDDYLNIMKIKYEDYLVRFNRGISFRDQEVETYKESLLDVANESMKYFTGEVRHSKILDVEDVFELQTRQDPTDLELLIRDVLGQFVKIFLDKFNKVIFT